MIHLIGPGGAGKTTAGARLAGRVNRPFVDLDHRLLAVHGDISAFIARHGYVGYARRNVETYLTQVATGDPRAVVALSSGFMTYTDDIHEDYVRLRTAIACSPATFVLLPSLDLETCVQEIVRRQAMRAFGGSAAQEETVIRERFPIYMAVPARKIETMRSPDEVAAEIAAALACLTR